MFKFKFLVISLLIIVLPLVLILFYDNNYHEIITNSNYNSIKNTNTLNMMYETEYDSGEYQVSNDTTWPESGYIFNAELSKCENGSKLIWDDKNKRVVMQANTSDK